MSTSEDSSQLDNLSSIFEHYQRCMPNPLANLSPGNDVARRFGMKEFNLNIRRSVVSVSTFRVFSGVEKMIECSGFVIGWNSSKNEGIILTTAKVLRRPKMPLRKHFHICEGGPIVTESGDVIGMSFVDFVGDVHILPSDSILDTLLACKLSRDVIYPWYGLTVIDADKLSLEVREFFSISCDDERRVFVKQVFDGSPAHKLEVYPGDRVISCGRICVDSAEKYCQIVRTISGKSSGVLDPTSADIRGAQLEIQRRADDKIVTVEAEFRAVNDPTFRICWPFKENIWYSQRLAYTAPSGPALDTFQSALRMGTSEFLGPK